MTAMPYIALVDLGLATFVELIQESDRTTFARMRKVLVDRGFRDSAVRRAWDKARPVLKQDPRIKVDGLWYSWSGERAAVPAPDGLLAEVERLRADKERLEALLRETHNQQVSFRAAQDRQLRIDAMRSLAELAIEVEELVANGAGADVLIERVRVLAEINSLEPIGQVGVQLPFDPACHTPLAGYPDAGSPVSVVRPGYTWHAGGEDVLLERAVVA
jgi:hypothetical protein